MYRSCLTPRLVLSIGAELYIFYVCIFVLTALQFLYYLNGIKEMPTK